MIGGTLIPERSFLRDLLFEDQGKEFQAQLILACLKVDSYWDHVSQEAVPRIASVTGMLRLKVPSSEVNVTSERLGLEGAAWPVWRRHRARWRKPGLMQVWGPRLKQMKSIQNWSRWERPELDPEGDLICSSRGDQNWREPEMYSDNRGEPELKPIQKRSRRLEHALISLLH